MSKTFLPGLIYTVTAAAATAKGLFIKPTGAVCAASEKALGVSYDESNDDGTLAVVLDGIVPVIAGGSITAGDPVTSDANGKAVKAASVAVAAPTVAAPTVALEAGDVPVTADAATPTINVTAGEVTTGEISGGVLPVAINGYALEDASEGETVLVKLV